MCIAFIIDSAMQLFAGLEPTGTVNAETRELLITPRCGNPDVFGANEMQRPNIRARRYATSRNISYFIAS